MQLRMLMRPNGTRALAGAAAATAAVAASGTRAPPVGRARLQLVLPPSRRYVQHPCCTLDATSLLRSSGSRLAAQRLLPRGLTHSTVAAAAAAQEQQQEQQSRAADDAERQAVAVEYVVVNFYHLCDVENPGQVIGKHREWLEGKDVRGRIYVSEQGINAQYGGERGDAVGYARWLADTQPQFKGLSYSVWPVAEHMYPKLRLKYRPNLISLAGGMQALPEVTRPEARATPTSPAEWKRMLSEAQRLPQQQQGDGGGVDPRQLAPLVLDVRNSYEWDAGHFVGAERPLEDNFNQTPTEALPVEVPPYLQAADPDRPIMIYCTGGIRCDVYGTYLRKKGFNNLYTLEGGIQNYMREEGLDHWDGSLFVFDSRMAIRPNKDKEEPLVAAAPCQVCGGAAALPHMNCSNIDCNKLYIACDACKTKFSGCCCEGCMSAPRLLRPVKTSGQYGNWSQYIGGEDEGIDPNHVIASGRGEGRVARRRKRQQLFKERGLAKRVEKLDRRALVKQALSSHEQQQQEGAAGAAAVLPAAATLEVRLARLRELRQPPASAPASGS